MSDEESKTHDKKMNDWWKNLDSGLKMKVYNCFSDIKVNTEHIEPEPQLLFDEANVTLTDADFGRITGTRK